MLKTILTAATISLTASTAFAATLDFAGFGAGTNGSTITVSGATITNTSGGDILVGSSAAGQNDGFCSISVTRYSCEADTEINFNAIVSNLSFWLDAANTGDNLALSLHGIGDALLATLNYTVPNQLIDLTGYGPITRLVFSDSSTGYGYGYSRFNFDNTVAPVPLPASLPLFLGALGLFGAVKRRRKS